MNRLTETFVFKGICLRQLSRNKEAIAVYDELLARFGTATELGLRERISFALVQKAVSFQELGRRHEAIAVYDDQLARFRCDLAQSM